MVGRQIVDRAKIQRIIFEFDYYEKAFHQFYDTYRVVPGNLDEKTCHKYESIFNKDCDRQQCTYKSGGGTSSIVIKQNRGDNINYGFLNKRAANTPMMHLKYAGLIDFEFEDVSNGGYQNHCKLDGEGGTSSSASIGKFLNYTKPFFPKASFNSSVYVRVLGMNFTIVPDLHIFKNASTSPHSEFTTKQKQSLDKKNTIIMSIPFVSQDVEADPSVKNAVLTAKLTSELDAKIDDGRPETGKLIGMRAIYGLFHPEVEVCHDGNGIYLSSDSNRYGCNIVYAMENIK